MNPQNHINDRIAEKYIQSINHGLGFLVLLIGIPFMGFNGVRILIQDTATIGFFEIFLSLLFFSAFFFFLIKIGKLYKKGTNITKLFIILWILSSLKLIVYWLH